MVLKAHPGEPDTEELLRQATAGVLEARERLFGRYRDRLRRMVTLRLDRALAARADPSDVVQEALAAAAQDLSDYLRRRPLPFYPWLRQYAWDRLVELHRHHVKAQRRSVNREQPGGLPALPDESVADLAARLMGQGSSPSYQLQRIELREALAAALARLGERDREILVLRHLEELSTKETAAVLGVSEGAVKLRHLRALQRLRTVWDKEGTSQS